MKNSIIALAVITFLFMAHAPAADTHYYFKASAMFPVQIEKDDGHGGTALTKLTLGTKELINLTLARHFDYPLQTSRNQYGSKTDELLIVNVNQSNPNSTVLQVYQRRIPGHNDPDQSTGYIYNVCILAGSTAMKMTDKAGTDKEKGTGLGPGTIVGTDPNYFSLQDRNLNSLQSTDICASTNASWTPKEKVVHDHANHMDYTYDYASFNTSATGIIGDIKGFMTSRKTPTVTVPLDGLIIKGSFTGAGSPLEPFPYGVDY